MIHIWIWYNHHFLGPSRHVLASAEIANIRCLRLVNEHTAIALSYSVFKDAKVRST